nr:AarF/ABC1/UbiB kinase family protein [Kineosphaera limosa]
MPRRAIVRTAKLASLPIGVAGRAAWGAGKRLGGKPAEAVAAELQARTAEQLFTVLGELKGGAMKVGQALSVLEAAMPEEFSAPYRATLTKLQDSAPSLPTATVHQVLSRELGPRWRTKFAQFDDAPTAAASVGQVHHAIWKDGREVAVKIQYPGAGEALVGDFRRMAQATRMLASWVPGLDLGPILAELVERVEDELDYALEANSQRRFGEAFEGDPEVFVPAVVHQKGAVIITEWMEGVPLSRIIGEGTPTQRAQAATRYLEFLVAGPQRARLLHADPHPGNFRLLPDGRLGVLDFGAVQELPDGLPTAIGRLLTYALRGEAEPLLAGLRDEGFVLPTMTVQAEAVLNLIEPFLEPFTVPTYTLRRSWLRGVATRLQDPRGEQWRTSIKLNLPREYLLIERVWIGGLGVLAQLEGEVPVAQVLARWLPEATYPVPRPEAHD